MKIIVTDSGYTDWTYEGEDLYPLVDERSERLDILDHKGRPLAIYPRGNWFAVNVEHDEGDEGEDGPSMKKLADDIYRNYGKEEQVHWADNLRFSKETLAGFIWNWRHTIKNRDGDVPARYILDNLETTFELVPKGTADDKDEPEEGEQEQSPVTIDLPQKHAFTREEVLDLLGSFANQVGTTGMVIRHTTH
jgi:hypothetical protein